MLQVRTNNNRIATGPFLPNYPRVWSSAQSGHPLFTPLISGKRTIRGVTVLHIVDQRSVFLGYSPMVLDLLALFLTFSSDLNFRAQPGMRRTVNVVPEINTGGERWMHPSTWF